MKRRVYALLDTVGKSFGPLMLFPHDAAAIRSFGDVLADPQSLPARHPDDFDLMYLGDYVTEFGQEGFLSPLLGAPPVRVMSGAQWKAAQQERES